MSFLFKVWRSIRLIVDPGLNYFGMKRDEVLDYFKNYAWAESPFVLSEVKRNIVKSNVCLIIIHLLLFKPLSPQTQRLKALFLSVNILLH